MSAATSSHSSSSSMSVTVAPLLSRLSFVDTFIMLSSMLLPYFDDDELQSRVMPLSVGLFRLGSAAKRNLVEKQNRHDAELYNAIHLQVSTITAVVVANSVDVQFDLDQSLRLVQYQISTRSNILSSYDLQQVGQLIERGAQFTSYVPHRSLEGLAQEQCGWMTNGEADVDERMGARKRMATSFAHIRSLLLSLPPFHQEQLNLLQLMLREFMNLSMLFLPRDKISIGQISIETFRVWYQLLEWLLTLIQIHIDEQRKNDRVESATAAAYQIYYELTRHHAHGICWPQVRRYQKNKVSLLADEWDRRHTRPWCDTVREARQLARMQRMIWRRCLMTVVASAPIRQRIIEPHTTTNKDLHLLISTPMPLHRPDLCIILFEQSRQYQHDFHVCLHHSVESAAAIMKEWMNRFFASRTTRRTLELLLQSGAFFKLLCAATVPSRAHSTTSSSTSPALNAQQSMSLSDMLIRDSPASRLIHMLYFQLIRGKEVRLLQIFHSLIPHAVMFYDPETQLPSLHFLLRRVNGYRERVFDLLLRESLKHRDDNIADILEDQSLKGVTLATIFQKPRNHPLRDRLIDLHPTAARLVGIELNPGPSPFSSSSSSMNNIVPLRSRLSFLDTFSMVSSIFLKCFTESELASLLPTSTRLSRLISTHLATLRTRREKLLYDEIQSQLATITAARDSNSPELQSQLNSSVTQWMSDIERSEAGDGQRFDSATHAQMADKLLRLILLGARLNPELDWLSMAWCVETYNDWFTRGLGAATEQWMLPRITAYFSFVRSILLCQPDRIKDCNCIGRTLLQILCGGIMKQYQLAYHTMKSSVSMQVFKMWEELVHWILMFMQIHIEETDQIFSTRAHSLHSELTTRMNEIRVPHTLRDPFQFLFQKQSFCASEEERKEFIVIQRRVWKRSMSVLSDAQLYDDTEIDFKRSKLSHIDCRKNARLKLLNPLPMQRLDLCVVLFTQSRQYQHDFHKCLNVLSTDVKYEQSCIKEWMNQFFASRTARRTLVLLLQSGAFLKLLCSSTSTLADATELSWSDLILHASPSSRLIHMLYFQLIRGKEVRLVHVFHSLVPAAVISVMRDPIHQSLPLHFLLQQVCGRRHRIFDLLLRAKHHVISNIDAVFEEKVNYGGTLADLLQRPKNHKLLQHFNEFYRIPPS